MELTNEKAVLATRNTFQFKVQKPEMDNLKAFSQILPDENRSDFKKTYGKILDLLSVNVQVEAVSALAQYYDPLLRCFTFSNFQLAPTLEEFARIIGQLLTKGKPYHFYGKYPTIDTVAKTLRVDPNKLKNKKQNQETSNRISRTRLEELMGSLVESKNWDVLVDVLALAIYDLVLFLSAGDLVGSGATDVFMARKCRGENSTFAILADVYYTLSFCHEKKGKRIICCLSVLYVWLTTHVFQRGYNSYCPIVDLRRLGLKTYNAKEWAQLFVELKEESVCWYPRWMDTTEVICQCGEFPNVPLIGTLGCINYNPTLALRQLCYPMMGPPAEGSIVPFMIDLKDNMMLDRIRQAWGNVICKSKELGRRSCGATDGYKQWVRDRVEQIKLPFQKLNPIIQQERDTVLEESQEMKEMKGKLVQLEAERDTLVFEFSKVCSDFATLKLEHSEKAQLLERENKRARIERGSMGRTNVCLRSANKQLGIQNTERDRKLKKNEQLRRTQIEMKQRLNALKSQIEEQASQHETTRIIDKQAFIEEIRGYNEHLEEKHGEVERLLKAKQDLHEENRQLRGEILNLKTVQAENQQRLHNVDLQMKEMIIKYETKIKNDKQEGSSRLQMEP